MVDSMPNHQLTHWKHKDNHERHRTKVFDIRSKHLGATNTHLIAQESIEMHASLLEADATSLIRLGWYHGVQQACIVIIILTGQNQFSKKIK